MKTSYAYQSVPNSPAANRVYSARNVENVWNKRQWILSSSTAYENLSLVDVPRVDQTKARTRQTLFDQLESIGRLPVDWSTYGAPRPATTAIVMTSRALELALSLGLAPEAIVPSAEGGAAICFRAGNKYAHIEFFNDGDIFAIRSDGRNPSLVWPVADDELTETLSTIDAFLAE